MVGINAPPPAHVPVIMTILGFNGRSTEALEFYAPLLSLPTLVNTTSSMAYPQMNTMLNEGLGPGLRRTMKGSAFKPPFSLAQAESFFSDFETFREEVPDAVATVILLEFVSFHKIVEKKQTEMAFANRGAYGNIVFAPGWTSEEFDGLCREWSREMGRKLECEC
jgi:hypothetical protein